MKFKLILLLMSMKQFMKISSSPGDVKDFMEALTE
jgi:hypothetical protein